MFFSPYPVSLDSISVHFKDAIVLSLYPLCFLVRLECGELSQKSQICEKGWIPYRNQSRQPR